MLKYRSNGKIFNKEFNAKISANDTKEDTRNYEN